jgi:hypothetical protein
MLMKSSVVPRSLPILAAIAAAAFLCPAWLSAADTTTDGINAERRAYASERKVIVAEGLQLTESESAAFWPLYSQYRAQQEKSGDELIKLVLEYADVYPNVPEKQAARLLKGYASLEKELASSRASYLKRFARVLPASKALRLAQLENRLDLAMRMQLASTIPLSPVEGRLLGQMSGTAIFAQGIPGGTVVQTYELTAAVTAMDQATRRLTLLSPDGIKQTVKVGPEAINFDQIRVGDQLRITVAEELVVFVAGDGEAPSQAAAQIVALAPQGAKPGGIMAETTQLTAKIAALDSAQHRATLEFEDGSTRTVAVRKDVDLEKRRVGDKVVIRVTEAVALSVKKP